MAKYNRLELDKLIILERESLCIGQLLAGRSEDVRFC